MLVWPSEGISEFFSTEVPKRVMPFFNRTQSKNPTYELEALAVVLALRVWAQCIAQGQILMFSDMEALLVLSYKEGAKTP